MIANDGKIEIRKYLFKDDGIFPNNKKLPVLLYKNAFKFSKEDNAVEIENTFRKNRWKNAWRDGIYHFHHYHSTAHEALGVYSGNVMVQVGGERGEILKLSTGDVLIIPAGVAHKNAGSSVDFKCVGAYPVGQNYDINYGDTEERPQADKNIEKVKLPAADPVFGRNAGLTKDWITKSKDSNAKRKTPVK